MSDEPGFGPETHGTYEPTAEEIAARARRPDAIGKPFGGDEAPVEESPRLSRQVDDALDRLERDISFLESVIRSDEGYTETVIAQCIDAREDIATVRDALERLREERDAWMDPFDGSGVEWHEGLPNPYTYQASDFSKLVSAVHEYECHALAAEAEVRQLREERDFWKGTADCMAEEEIPKLVKRYRAEVRRLTEGLTRIRANANSWHGMEGKGSGHDRALRVIASWCDALLSASPSGGGGA